MKLSVIVPVFNEADTIDTVIENMLSVKLPTGYTREILIINDGSTDSTSKLLKKHSNNPLIRMFAHRANLGKSASVRLGIKKATGDLILIQDADLEYDPLYYPHLLKPIIENKADIVYGSRFKGSIRNMTFINRAANLFSNITLNFIFHSRLTDINTCFKLFRSDLIKGIEIESSGFMLETEITAKLLRKGHSILEVPIAYNARSCYEGKKISWPKALKMYWGIFRYGLFPSGLR